MTLGLQKLYDDFRYVLTLSKVFLRTLHVSLSPCFWLRQMQQLQAASALLTSAQVRCVCTCKCVGESREVVGRHAEGTEGVRLHG